MKGLKITFLLPGSSHLPTGGNKVVYEYANHLSRRGHRVTLVHPALVATQASPLQAVRGAISFVHRGMVREYRPKRWFPLEPAVRTMWVPTLSSWFIPDGDVILATAWATAEWVVDYPAEKGEKFYLIQSWETWSGPEDRVRATWKTPLKKIVIARWLRDMAREMGIECTYIPNGIDSEQFGLDAPIESRDHNRLMMLYHSHPVKGSADGLEALSLVRRQLPDLRVTLFGASPAPVLPSWAEYHKLPSPRMLRALYNQASVFVSPGRIEGWPLPPAEAMLCGAALAATDIGGHREYAVHEETALLSPAKDPERLAENILRLACSPELRTSIAQRAHQNIQRYSWARAVDSLESALDNYGGCDTAPTSYAPVTAKKLPLTRRQERPMPLRSKLLAEEIRAHADHDYLKFHKQRFEYVVSKCQELCPSRSTKVLDIGRSNLSRMLLEKYDSVTTLGLPLSDNGEFGSDAKCSHESGSFADGYSGHIVFDLNNAQTVDALDWQQKFDLIVFAETIEHLYTAPELVLNLIKSLLADSGVIVCQTPNAAFLTKRIKLLLGQNPYERLRMSTINRGHIREYTSDELIEAGARAGLVCVASEYKNYFGVEGTGLVRAARQVVDLISRIFPSMRRGLTVIYSANPAEVQSSEVALRTSFAPAEVGDPTRAESAG
ncbi:MAG TPA: glycosyltransferase [Terriglobales bacterium]|nr:glycosyltransferase [Terriglobales bacterium]